MDYLNKNFIVKTLSYEDDIVGTILIHAETKYCSEWTRSWNHFFKSHYILKENNPDLLFMTKMVPHSRRVHVIRIRKHGLGSKLTQSAIRRQQEVDQNWKSPL